MQVNPIKFRELFSAGAKAFVFALLSFLLLVPAEVSAQENPSQTVEGAAPESLRRGEAAGQSIIRGRVLYDDTGRPVRRAAVMLFRDLKHPAVRSTVANRRGEFRFASLAAGTYFIVADVPGTISMSSGFRISDLGLTREGADEDQVHVSVDGKREAQAEVRVRRGGTISGRITYADNEPVLGGRVILYRRQGTRSELFFTDPVLTDDLGAYRIEGLPAGDYLVGVIEKYSGGEVFKQREHVGLVAAYYPAAKGVSDAKVVQVTAGSETKEINIKLAEDDLRRISGTVVWRGTGQAAEEATILLQRKDEPKIEVSFTDLLQSITPPGMDKDDTLMRDMSLMMLMTSNSPQTEVDAKGHWRFVDVPSGTYIITAIASPPAKEDASAKEGEPSEMDKAMAALGRRFVTQRLELVVADEDETGVKIELSEGGRISGDLVVEDPPAPGARILLEYDGAHPLLNLPYYTNPDGTFLLAGVPAGEVRLDVRLPPASTHYVKSISSNGQDLLRAPLRVADGAHISGVRVTLARGRATLSGHVKLSGGGVAAGAGVLLVPVDEKLWQLRGARIFGRADAEGAFSVSVAPGDYLVFTWSPKDEPTQSIEEYVRTRFAAARRVSLQANESKSMDLILTASAPADKRD